MPGTNLVSRDTTVLQIEHFFLKECLWPNGESRPVSYIFCHPLPIIPDTLFMGSGSRIRSGLVSQHTKEKRFSAYFDSSRLSGTFAPEKMHLAGTVASL